jgi:hypothetical protein
MAVFSKAAFIYYTSFVTNLPGSLILETGQYIYLHETHPSGHDARGWKQA